MDKDIEEFLSTLEVARILGLSSERIRQLVTEKKLQPVNTHLGYLFDPKVIEKFRQEREGAKNGQE